MVGHGALVHGQVSTSASNSTTSSAFDVSRWISYAGLALLGGTWLLFTTWPQGRDDYRASGIGWAGVGLTALGAVLELALQGPFAAGDAPGKVIDGSLFDDTLHTTYGQLHCVRLVLIGAARPRPGAGVAGTGRTGCRAAGRGLPGCSPSASR